MSSVNSRDLVVRLHAQSQGFERGMKSAAASADVFARELDKIDRKQAQDVAYVARLRMNHEKQVAAQQRATAQATAVGATSQRRSLRSVTSAAGAMSTGVGLSTAAAGAAMIAMGKASVQAASGLNEQLTATRTLFREAADEVIAFGESAAAIGLSERAALQAANGFGDLFVKLGYTHDAAAVFSEDLVRIAADFASFKDLDPEDVLLKLKSGLAGEAEPMRALGVFLNEAQVKAEGAALGLGDLNGKLSEGEKVTARYSLIMKGMGDAYGDVSRTADDYANTQRRAAAETENLKASIGQQLLPVLTDLSYVATEAGKGFKSLSDSTGGLLGAAATTSPVSMLADAIRGLKGESEEAAENTNYLTDSQAILANAQEHTKEEVEQATAAIEAQQQALDRLLQATIAQLDSELRYQLAVLGITDAIADYDKALKTNSDGKADNDLTAAELTKKEIGLKEALLSAGDAAVKQAEDQAAAAGRVLTESEKFDLFRAALIQLKEQFPELSGQIDAYVRRLDSVPATVKTGVTVDTAAATASLVALDRLLDDLSGRSVTTQVKTIRSTQELFLPGGLAPVRKAEGGLVFHAGDLSAQLATGGYVLAPAALPTPHIEGTHS
jgi:hypothetical protein